MVMVQSGSWTSKGGLRVQCDEDGVRTGLATLESRGRWLRCVARVRTVSWAMKEEWELPDRENVGAEAVGRTHWLCKG